MPRNRADANRRMATTGPHQEPPKSEERDERRTHLALAVTIFAPVVAIYAAVGYRVYRAVAAIF